MLSVGTVCEAICVRHKKQRVWTYVHYRYGNCRAKLHILLIVSVALRCVSEYCVPSVVWVLCFKCCVGVVYVACIFSGRPTDVVDLWFSASDGICVYIDKYLSAYLCSVFIFVFSFAAELCCIVCWHHESCLSELLNVAKVKSRSNVYCVF